MRNFEEEDRKKKYIELRVVKETKKICGLYSAEFITSLMFLSLNVRFFE